MEAKTKTTERSVGEAIRELRVYMGETQTEFARTIGISISTLARYETVVQRPKPSITAKLAKQAQSSGLPDLAILFQKAFREQGEKANRVRALRREEDIIPRLLALKQSTERLTKESEKLLRTLTSQAAESQTHPDHARILRTAKATLHDQARTIENLRTIVEQYDRDLQSKSSAEEK